MIHELTHFEYRCLKAIKRRVDWLSENLGNKHDSGRSWDEKEKLALLWIIEQADMKENFDDLYEQEENREGNRK